MSKRRLAKDGFCGFRQAGRLGLSMKRTGLRAIVITAIILVIVSVPLICVLCNCRSFSADEYEIRIRWYEQLSHEDIQLGDGEIDSKREALLTARPFLEQRYDIGPCVYSVFYDAENHCWLVRGTMFESWIKSSIGGTQNVIIRSDGTVIAVWLGV